MNAGEVWWPSAFEKAIEQLGQRTTYILASRAMTMITSFPATFNLTTNSGFSDDEVPGGLADEDGTWEFFKEWSMKTPITVQTLEKMDGVLQKNHVFTVMGAEEVSGVKTLHLHDPLGWDESLPFKEAWPQFYLLNYIQGLPTRESFGLSPNPPHQDPPVGVSSAVKPSSTTKTSTKPFTSSAPKEQATTVRTALVSSPVSSVSVSRSLVTLKPTKVPEGTDTEGTRLSANYAKIQSDKDKDDVEDGSEYDDDDEKGMGSRGSGSHAKTNQESGPGKEGDHRDSMLQRLGQWFGI